MFKITLREAAEIIDTYSNGSLPEPTYVTVNEYDGRGIINFQMTDVEDVKRWAESVDVEVSSVPWSDSHTHQAQVHHLIHFTHGESTLVQVYFVVHVTPYPEKNAS